MVGARDHLKSMLRMREGIGEELGLSFGRALVLELLWVILAAGRAACGAERCRKTISWGLGCP